MFRRFQQASKARLRALDALQAKVMVADEKFNVVYLNVA